VSESAKLTIKVKLHGAPTALPADLPPVAVTTHWSVPRVLLALALLLLLSGCVWWLLVEPSTVLSTKPIATPAAVLVTNTAPQTELASPLSSEALVTAPNVETAPASAQKPATKVAPALLPQGFSRIVLTAQMERLEPGTPLHDQVERRHIQRLYLFTELRGYAGQQLLHRWWYQGELQTEVLLTIEDSPWRTYSEKWLLPAQMGLWRVEILDQAQNVLYQHDFQYQ
jgi:hypothetical protein